MESVIELSGVSRRFGAQAALDGVSLSIRRGEFACLVGHSGAGKTTLLSVINRQVKPTSGEVWVDELPAHRLSPHDLPKLRRRVATVYQDHKLLPHLTALENVIFAVNVTDIAVSDAEARERALQALRSVDMDRRADAFPRELSYGQCQRVALARAIVPRPLVLLADEPTGNLDQKTANSIVDLLLRIGKRGTAIVLATHNLEVVQRLGKRVITLSGGRLVDDSTPRAAPLRKLRLVES